MGFVIHGSAAIGQWNMQFRCAEPLLPERRAAQRHLWSLVA